MIRLVVFVASFLTTMLCTPTGEPVVIADSVKPPRPVIYRGQWSKAGRYYLNDLVKHVGVFWRCEVDRCTVGKQPDRPEWSVNPGVRG